MLNLLVGNKQGTQARADFLCGDAVDKGCLNLCIIPFLIGVQKSGKENLFVKRRVFDFFVVQIILVLFDLDFQLDILVDFISAEKDRLLV